MLIVSRLRNYVLTYKKQSIILLVSVIENRFTFLHETTKNAEKDIWKNSSQNIGDQATQDGDS